MSAAASMIPRRWIRRYLITSPEKIEPGTFIDVKITGSTEFDLYAVPAETSQKV